MTYRISPRRGDVGRVGKLRNGIDVLSAALVVSLATFSLAPLGITALAAVAAVIGGVGLLWYEQGLFLPALTNARRTAASATASVQRRLAPPSYVVRFAVPVAIVGVGGLAYLLGAQGIVALAGCAALLVVIALMVLTQPMLIGLLRTPPSDVRDGPRKSAAPLTTARRRVFLIVATAGSLAGAWFLAGLGMKGVLAAGGAMGVIGCLLFVRDRSLFFVFATTVSMVIILHKSFSSIDLELSGGAVSVYVTSFDVMLALCYLIWMKERTLAADVRQAFRDDRRRKLQVPLFGAVLLLPSILIAPSTVLAVSELFRMAWMYLLYLYVSVRVRTRRHVQAVLGALAVYVSLQFVAVVLQWKTGGVLGLGFLGVPTQLGERVTNDGSLGRPFGTIIHPVFMGAVMGSLGSLALALACTLRRSLSKLSALALVPVCLLPLYLSHTRASLVAFLLVAAIQVAWAMSRRWVTRRTVKRTVAVLCVAVVALWPQISTKVSENFGTDHYYEEVQSRLELNDVAGKIIADHPLLGIGLNNFERAMGPYQRYGLIFADNPVHNVYLLYLAETGIIGFVGFAVVGLAMYALAMRLARSRDPLHAGIGLGFSGVVGFLMLEEILGFSLRQDVPLAMFWLLAGLSLSCSHQGRLAGTLPPRPRRPAVSAGDRGIPTTVHANRAAPRPGQTAGVRLALRRLVALALLSTLVVVGVDQKRSSAEPRSLSLVVTGVDRRTGNSAIFTIGPDGIPRQVTPNDGRVYSWPVWALDGTKIVYTARRGEAGQPEEVEIMNDDGSNVQRITSLGYRTGQPKLAPDGKSIIFTGLSPYFSLVAIYRIDLETLAVTNLSAKTQKVASLDADPRFMPDGRIVLAGNDGSSGPILSIGPDGGSRVQLLKNGLYNTDPDISPDGKLLAVATYRGTGSPGEGNRVEDVKVKVPGWFIGVHDLRTGKVRLVNQGLDCTGRTPDDPCTTLEPAAFEPRWSPSGNLLAFATTLDNTTSCICAVNADGTDPKQLFTTDSLAINWFDWAETTPHPPAPPLIVGSKASKSRMLITVEDTKGVRSLIDANSDLSTWRQLPITTNVKAAASKPTSKATTKATTATRTKGFAPEKARWSQRRDAVLFSARTPVPAVSAPHPAPPAGEQRRQHFTLDDLTPTQADVIQRNDVAALQVFLLQPDGTVRQLTDPWIEDWRDGLAPGDLHGNTDPMFVDGGQVIVFTSVSAKTGESSLIRLDLRTGETLSLTNATAGALKTDDERPAVSRDGKSVAFSTTIGSSKEIATVTVDGTSFTRRTDDDWFDTAPAWSPDGRSLVFSSYRKSTQLKLADEVQKDGLKLGDGWVLVRLDLATGKEKVLTKDLPAPAFDPSWSPDGDQIAFITRGASSFDVWKTPAAGGLAEPVAVTPSRNELSVDWK